MILPTRFANGEISYYDDASLYPSVGTDQTFLIDLFKNSVTMVNSSAGKSTAKAGNFFCGLRSPAVVADNQWSFACCLAAHWC